MDGIRQYILSVVCVAILCGMVRLFLPGKGGVHSAVNLITGIILTVTVISPLVYLDDLNLGRLLDGVSAEGQWAVSEGEQVAFDQYSGRIKEELKAYILNRANTLGMQIAVEVSVSRTMPPVPKQVTVKGSVSPYGKAQLTQSITEDLGIAEEDLIWIS